MIKLKLCVFLAAAAWMSDVHAVVVASGGPNNTAPEGFSFFDNIGTVNGASVIYLGDGWVMTADHVAGSLPSTVNFGGTNYATQAGSWERITNPSSPSGLSTLTDIVVFRLSEPPALPGVSLSTSSPTVGTDVIMIGNGRVQNSETFWDRTVVPGPNNDTWTPTTEELSNISGFTTSDTHQIRWGENEVHSGPFIATLGSTDVMAFSTQFDKGGFEHEAQGVTGDSGGGVFTFNGSSWELAGMMFSVGNFETQPGGTNTAVYGNLTYIADLSYYVPQILDIIPEPSSAVLGFLGAMSLLRRRRA